MGTVRKIAAEHTLPASAMIEAARAIGMNDRQCLRRI
jgi:ABC-type proline/glycine betaine transport system permease subunit